MNRWMFEANARTHPECLADSLFGSNKSGPLQVRPVTLTFINL